MNEIIIKHKVIIIGKVSNIIPNIWKFFKYFKFKYFSFSIFKHNDNSKISINIAIKSPNRLNTIICFI